MHPGFLRPILRPYAKNYSLALPPGGKRKGKNSARAHTPNPRRSRFAILINLREEAKNNVIFVKKNN
jgi:hypothetical protein